MRITNITNDTNFKAGKVHLYSDFDGTYCPAKHSVLHKIGANEYMQEYCQKMDSFFKSTEGDLHFHITTGRTFGEFEAIAHLLKMQGFHLPLPESFIAKNGSDEYIKNGTDRDFYINGKFPYSYSAPNKEKEEAIKQLTNWDGQKIKDYIRNLAREFSLRLVEADSENSVKDYGNNSLFSEGKLNSDDWRRLPHENGKIQKHETPIADYVMGARNDGNLKVNLIFSPDYGFCQQRDSIYDGFINKIKEFLNINNTSYSMLWEVPRKSNNYRNHCNITPLIEGKPLTKLFDTKRALSDAINNNDMVIVAGDGSNDFDMLNPLEYIKKEEWDRYRENTNCQYFYDADTHKKLSYIRDAFEGRNDLLKQELESNGFIKQIREMPLYAIIIDKNNNKSLRVLNETFGRFGRIVEVGNANLDEGIKIAIRNHIQSSQKFKAEMSENFRNFILGISKKKDYKILIFSVIALASASIAGLIYKNNKSGNSNENITNKE